VPKNQVLVFDGIVSRSPLLHALRLLTLVGEFTRGEELVVLILGYPDWAGCELCALQAVRFGVGKDHLAGRGHQLVCDRVVCDRVDDVVVTDFEYAILLHAGRGTAAGLDDILLGGVSDEVGVVVILWHGNTILIVDCVFVSVQRGINTQREQVLVEWGHHAGTNVCTPRHGLAIFIVKGHGGQDTGCANLELDVRCLVENECEDVFVVGDGANHLDHELAVTDDRRGASAVVCVFMLKAVVLLVHADDVLELDRLALGVCTITIKVFDVAKAIAAEGQLVRCDTEANVTNVEGLLAVVGGTRI